MANDLNNKLHASEFLSKLSPQLESIDANNALQRMSPESDLDLILSTTRHRSNSAN